MSNNYKVLNQFLQNSGNTYKIIKVLTTKSKSGDVYVCSCGGIKFVCKKYKKFSRLDIILSIKLSGLALNGVNPHFNIVYKYHKGCLLSELATGDLCSFLKEYIRYDVLISCLQQIFICVLSFHKHTDMAHNDCYHGNFIYRRIPKDGCFHYKINDKDIYVKHLGYQWMINDFDMACEDSDMHADYSVAMEAFIKYKRINKFSKVIEQVVNIIGTTTCDNDLFTKLIDSMLFAQNENINKNPFIL